VLSETVFVSSGIDEVATLSVDATRLGSTTTSLGINYSSLVIFYVNFSEF
jgi:hypothetical protein